MLFRSAGAERLPVKVYTSADGISSSFISHLMRDSRGFLWLATRDGLSRFDGREFTNYEVAAVGAPPGIEHILETRKGVYWIGTTGGLYRFDPKHSPKTTAVRNGDRAVLNAEFVSERRGFLFEDSSDQLWFVSGDLNIVENAGGKVSLRKVELGIPQNPLMGFAIMDFQQGRDGSFWMATSWGLIRRLPDGRQIFYSVDSSPTDLLTSVLEDSVGRIWIARSSGIYVVNPEPLADLYRNGNFGSRKLDSIAQLQTHVEVRLPERSGDIFKFTAIKGLDDGLRKYLFRSVDGHIWISTDSGIIEFDGRVFHSMTAAQGITGGPGRMVEDVDGNLWLGGDTGLVRLDRRGMTSFDEADGLKNLNILVIGESSAGDLYVGSTGFQVSLFDGKQFETMRPRLPLDSRALWTSNSVFLDSRNEWWFLTTENLYRFAALGDAKPSAVYDSDNGLKGSQMFHIFEDRQGDVWVSTRGAPATGDPDFGFSKFNSATERFHTFSATENYQMGKIPSAFAEDTDGNLWIGFHGGGLSRFSNGRFAEINGKENLPPGFVTALHLDKKGRLWLSTALGGVCRIDDPSGQTPRFVRYTTENGLSSNNARSITEDNFGQIYIGTARGVDRITPESGRIKHYSTNDGLAGDFVSTAFRDSLGALWFGTPSGLSRLVPEQSSLSSPSRVWLKGLRVAGESRPVSELGDVEISNLELASNQNNLQIDFFAIDFNGSEALGYEFMLEGADTDWSVRTEQRTVNYSNLSAGNYRFLVRAVTPDGISSEPPASVSFTIVRPIWQRWWFVMLVSLALAMFVYSLYRYRLRQLLHVERTRTRIATDLHDDIGASLSRIALLSEVVKQQNGGSSSVRLTQIADDARGLVDSMSDIVWSIDPRSDSLSSVGARVRSFAADTLGELGIKWTLETTAELSEVRLSSDLRRALYLILKEAITNIARHAHCRNAHFKISSDRQDILVEVEDDGCGIGNGPAAGTSRGGHGLENMRRRAVELGGELEITSSEKGTKLVFSLPRSKIKSMFMLIRPGRK